jgi:nitrogen regulatory protein P-II 1
MPELITMVLDDPGKTQDVLQAWIDQGVTGTTILDSRGLFQEFCRRGARDDLPIFPSLSALMHCREEPHHTLFAIVPDDFDVEALVAATEAVTGPLSAPGTGILWVMPIARVWGLTSSG